MFQKFKYFLGGLFSFPFLLAFFLVIVEIQGQFVTKAKQGTWLWKERDFFHLLLFQRHPWLVGAGKPNVYFEGDGVEVSHNNWGFRGLPISLLKAADKKRLVCYGGSSTYCIMISDKDTWPHLLQENLGDHFEVINAGVPGYSTAENIIQTSLQQLDLKPDIALYYVGWNDLRNMHIRNLQQDYSDFHAQTQQKNLHLDRLAWGYNSYVIRLLQGFIERTFLRQQSFKLQGKTTSDLDERALHIYRYNLQTLISICKSRNIQIVLVPQVENSSVLKQKRTWRWMPFIKGRDVKKFLAIYNDALIKIAEENKVECIPEVLEADWKREDFVDMVHFSPKGSKKFADTVSKFILAHSVTK